MLFSSESELVHAFGKTIGSQYTTLPKMDICFEFLYAGGKTDIIGVTKQGILHAFEAKLKRWRDCLYQAYRNTSFCHYSYVLLPADIIKNALKGAKLFRKLGVGLCSFENGKIHVHIYPEKQEPLQPWLTQRAITSALGGCCGQYSKVPATC